MAYLLLAHYPLYNDTVPSSAPAFQFSLVLIPALAAPMALMLHLFALGSDHPAAVGSSGPLNRRHPGERVRPLDGASVLGIAVPGIAARWLTMHRR